jgi:hypothetical protein
MALTDPHARAYNDFSLMADRWTELILGPPSRRRAAAFWGHGCGLYLQPAGKSGCGQHFFAFNRKGQPAVNIGARRVRAVLAARREK